MNASQDGQVLVVGAGAAGLGAALAAARAGATVTLAERAGEVGGTVTHALIHTLGGIYNDQGELSNPGLPAELVGRLRRADGRTGLRRIGRTRVLNVDPAVYRRVVEEWLAEEPAIELLPSTAATAAEVDSGVLQRVRLEGDTANRVVSPAAVVDASGSAELVRLAVPGAVWDAPREAAAGLVLQIRGVRPGALRFPRGVGLMRSIHAAAQAGELPADCARAWLDQGVYEDEVYLKLFVPLGVGEADSGRQGEVPAGALESSERVLALLRHDHDFAQAVWGRKGALGVRDGGSFIGEYTLGAEDVRSQRRFEDAACRCSWPIEYWDPARGVSLEYLPASGYYEIPLRSLRVAGVTNLWGAGKCLSAEPLARASARVVGCCWAMGEAAGKAAAAAADFGTRAGEQP